MNSASSTIPCRASSSLISRCSHYVCQIVVWRTNLEVTPTALGRIEDRVDGLDAGADDYLVKPFAPAELVSRVQALGRRYAQGGIATKLRAGPLEIDLIAREVRRGGRVVTLQPREFRLLEVLMRQAGEYVTRTMLLEQVWDFHFDPQTKIVETHMSRLRAKLNEGGLPDLIETARGAGYRVRAT